MAARIGAQFGMDPVVVLDEPDWRRNLIRIAAAVIVAQDETRRWGGDDA